MKCTLRVKLVAPIDIDREIHDRKKEKRQHRKNISVRRLFSQGLNREIH